MKIVTENLKTFNELTPDELQKVLNTIKQKKAMFDTESRLCSTLVIKHM